MFDTKIAIAIREDLQTWQKLNVTAFLISGISGRHPEILGEPYMDAANNLFHPLCVQPIIILSADQDTMNNIHRRAIERGVASSAYIEEMFSTGDDVSNRAVFSKYSPDNATVVGIGVRAEKKIADKIMKGAKMHG